MSAPATASKTTRNAFVLIIATIFSSGIQLVWQLALTTALGPEMYGIYGTVVSLMAVSTAVVNFGLGIIFIRDVAREPHKMGQYWTARLFLQTVLGLIAYLMSVGAALLAGYDNTILAYTAIGGISLIIDIFGTITSDMLIAQERMTIRAAVEIGYIVVRILLSAVLLSLGWSLLGVYIATLATGVLRSVLLWSTHTSRGFWPEMPLNRPLAWHMFRDSSPMAVAAFFNLLYQHIDKLITTALIGARSTGYLGPAFTISTGVIEVLNTTILTALFPMMSRQYVDDPRAFGRLLATLTRLMFVLTLPVAFTITLFAEPIVLMIFKAQYAPTIGVLRFLIWFTFLTMIGNVLVQAMQVQNRQQRVLWIRAGGLAVNIVFTTGALVITRDPQGAALSAAVSQALVLALLFLQFPELLFEPNQPARLGLNPKLVQGGLYVGRVALVALITSAVMLLIGQIHFILGSLVGLVVYAGLILRWGLNDSDRALVWQIVGVLPGGAWLRGRFA